MLLNLDLIAVPSLIRTNDAQGSLKAGTGPRQTKHRHQQIGLPAAIRMKGDSIDGSKVPAYCSKLLPKYLQHQM